MKKMTSVIKRAAAALMAAMLLLTTVACQQAETATTSSSSSEQAAAAEEAVASMEQAELEAAEDEAFELDFRTACLEEGFYLRYPSLYKANQHPSKMPEKQQAYRQKAAALGIEISGPMPIDLVDFAYTTEDTDAALEELLVAFAANPPLAASWIEGIGNEIAPSGRTYAEINGTWYPELLDLIQQAKSEGWMVLYTTTDWQGDGTTYTDAAEGHVWTSQEYHGYLTMFMDFLRMVDHSQWVSWTSYRHYPLEANMDARFVQCYEETEVPDSLPALLFQPAIKSGEETVVLGYWGSNAFDKRLEFFQQPEPEVPTPTTWNPPTPPTGEDPPTPPPTVHKKDPSLDPVNNGNAERGGGSNKPGDGSGDWKPKPSVVNHDDDKAAETLPETNRSNPTDKNDNRQYDGTDNAAPPETTPAKPSEVPREEGVGTTDQNGSLPTPP